MAVSAVEERTRVFYEWELIGRGWQTYSYPVQLEPDFRPFPGHQIARPAIPDDGRKPTFLSRLTEAILPPKAQPLAELPPREERPFPEVPPRDDLVEFEILVPSDTKVDSAAMESWLRAAMAASGALAFELLGRRGEVSIRVVAPSDGMQAVEAQIRAFFPEARVRLAEETLLDAWASIEATHYSVVEFGLAREFMLPLRELEAKPDPLTPLVAALAESNARTMVAVQVLFEPVSLPWAAHGMSAVTSPDGTPFFADAPEITNLAEEKFSAPLFAVCLRVLANAESEWEAQRLVRTAASCLNQYGAPNRNAFVPLAYEDGEDLVRDILLRSTHRSGMILSLPELTSIVRLPTEHLRHPALIRTPEPESILPGEVLGDGVSFGEAKHRKAIVPVRINTEARTQHTYVIGASGTGKSTLLENLILQDIAAGHGVGVVDPHGDLVDEILGRLPASRIDDVILFDPSDPDWVVGWNILDAHSEIEKELLASDLVEAFKRQATSWGDQMTAVLGNAVLAFLESTRGGTISDLRRFLLEDAFRLGFLNTVEDDHIRSFWQDEFPLLIGKKPQAPILTRLDIFLRSKLVRAAVTEKEKGLNFRDIIDGRKIFLAKLSQGTIGEENAALLGSLLVSKFHQVSLSRANIAEAERQPFFLFIDEFHHMATPSMAGRFSGVRKYRLALTVAHQDLYQLHAHVPEVERSVLSSSYTRVVFRVSDEDARKLEKGLGDFTAEDLVDQGRGEAIVRVGRRDHAFKIKTVPLPDISADEASSRRSLVRDRSMERYGRPRAEVRSRPSTRQPEPVRFAEASAAGPTTSSDTRTTRAAAEPGSRGPDPQVPPRPHPRSCPRARLQGGDRERAARRPARGRFSYAQ